VAGLIEFCYKSVVLLASRLFVSPIPNPSQIFQSNNLVFALSAGYDAMTNSVIYPRLKTPFLYYLKTAISNLKTQNTILLATKKSYPTDSTDNQWEMIKDLIPAAGTGCILLLKRLT